VKFYREDREKGKNLLKEMMVFIKIKLEYYFFYLYKRFSFSKKYLGVIVFISKAKL